MKKIALAAVAALALGTAACEDTTVRHENSTEIVADGNGSGETPNANYDDGTAK